MSARLSKLRTDDITCVEIPIVGQVGRIEVHIASESSHAQFRQVLGHQVDSNDITRLHGRAVGFQPEFELLDLFPTRGGTTTSGVEFEQCKQLDKIIVIYISVVIEIVCLVFGPIGIFVRHTDDSQEGDNIVVVNDVVAVEVAALVVGILDGEGDGGLRERRAGIGSDIHFRQRDGDVVVALHVVIAVGLDGNRTGVLASGDDGFRIHTEVNTGGERVGIGRRDQRVVESDVSCGGDAVGKCEGDDHLVAFVDRVGFGRQSDGRVVIGDGDFNRRIIEDDRIIRTGDGVGKDAVASQQIVSLVQCDRHSRFTGLDGFGGQDFTVFDEVNDDIAFELVAEADGQFDVAFRNRRFGGGQRQIRPSEGGRDDDFAVFDGGEHFALEVQAGQCDTSVFVGVVQSLECDGATFGDFLKNVECDGRIDAGGRGGFAVGAAEADADDLVAILDPGGDIAILLVISREHLGRVGLAIFRDIGDREDRVVEHDAEVAAEQHIVGFEVDVDRDGLADIRDIVLFIRIDRRREGQSGLREVERLARFAGGVRDTVVGREERVGLQGDGDDSVAVRSHGDGVGGLVAVHIFDGLDDAVFNGEVGGDRVVDNGFAHRQRIGDGLAVGAGLRLCGGDDAGQHVAHDCGRLVEQRDGGGLGLAGFVFIDTPQTDRVAADRQAGHRKLGFRGDFADFAVIQLPFVGGQAVELDAQRVAVNVQRINGINRVGGLRDRHGSRLANQRVDGAPDSDDEGGFILAIGADECGQRRDRRDVNGLGRAIDDFIASCYLIMVVLEGVAVILGGNLQLIDLAFGGVRDRRGHQFEADGGGANIDTGGTRRG